MSKKVLGLWNMGDSTFHRMLSPSDSKNLIKEAIRSGITAFDSAYSYKSADNYLYSAIKELSIERQNIEITTKVMPIPTLEKKVETCLNRLHTNYIDALLLHWPADDASIFKSLKRLENLKAKGIVKKIGVSNFPLQLLKKAISDFSIEIHERPLSLIWNKNYEDEKELAIDIYGYAPLGMGTLSKDVGQEEFEDTRKDLYIFKDGFIEYKDLMSEIRKLSEKYECSFANIALSWVESIGVYAVVFGASKKEHLKLNEINLEKEEICHLSSLASNLSRKTSSDNIFCHDYLRP